MNAKISIAEKQFKPHFSPSLMCMDLLHIEKQLQILNQRADSLHIDIMDGHYVKNLTLSPMFVKQIRPYTQLPIHVHLMVEYPNDYIDELMKNGSDCISVHPETIVTDAFRILRNIHSGGCQAGAVINPSTSLQSAAYYLHEIDILTIMTIDIGFAGQPFLVNMLEKIQEAVKLRRQNNYHYRIEVDGSCNQKTFACLYEAGCEDFIVGTSGLFSLHENLNQAYDIMLDNFKDVCDIDWR